MFSSPKKVDTEYTILTNTVDKYSSENQQQKNKKKKNAHDNYNHVIKQHGSNRTVDVVYTCVCPCVVFGNMKSLASREKIICTCSSMDIHFGRSGITTCLHSTTYCCLCWPISPMIGYNVHIQSEKLKIIYNQETTMNGFYDIPKCLWTLFTWPWVLHRNQSFLLSKYNEGTLRFDWEENILEDLLQPKPKSRDRLVTIIGSKYSGKTTLFKKILFYTDSNNNNNIKSKNQIKTSVGIKPYKFSKEFIDFMEVWDISTDEVNTKSNRYLIETAQNIILMYDCSDITGESFQQAKLIYDSIHLILKPDCIIWCVANKLDLIQDDHWIIQGQEWCKEKNIIFQKISCIDFVPKQDIF